jgi:peptidoglycan/xylan/chitin deacetylase (PgdA/CDA1 family)
MTKTMKHQITLLLLLLATNIIFGQSFVSITIDDVPNTIKYQKDNFESKLMNKLDSLKIPVTVFVNEELLNKGASFDKNHELLENWVKRDYVTIGNHTFSHSRYSDVGFNMFVSDIEKGEILSKALVDKYSKKLEYFRFPYNDLGKDSLEHSNIEQFLASKGYISTPFTIESSDWMYNAVYENHLANKEFDKAAEIGRNYTEKTLEYFEFYDSISTQIYNRKIKHIYLCHDNSINADYLPILVVYLAKRNYSFISLQDALTDSVYHQKDKYYKKWGISWIFRWMNSQKEISSSMKNEPNMELLETQFNNLGKNE